MRTQDFITKCLTGLKDSADRTFEQEVEAGITAGLVLHYVPVDALCSI